MSDAPKLTVIEGGKINGLSLALDDFFKQAHDDRIARLRDMADRGDPAAAALLDKAMARHRAKLAGVEIIECEHGRPLVGGCFECQKALARRALTLAVHTRALLDAVQGKVPLLGGDADRVERELDLLDVEGLVLA